jgi:ribosomal protein S27E
MSDVPLLPYVPRDGDTRPIATVVDLAGVKLRWGARDHKAPRPCEHLSLVYNQTERRVWCEDCNATVEGFDAFMTITKHFERMMSDAQHKSRTASEALRHSARLRATKELDRTWSGNVMAVACPHCRGGLLPEDFAGGAGSAWSRELEIARRKKAAADKT